MRISDWSSDVCSSDLSYKAQQQSDLLAKTAGELGGAGGAAPDIDGAYSVYEAYAEVVAPLIEDKPFFESLTLEAGIRYSDYSIRGAGDRKSTRLNSSH